MRRAPRRARRIESICSSRLGRLISWVFGQRKSLRISEFYITTYSDKVPDVKYDAHSLRIEGLVDKPYTLTMKELEAMKDRTEFVTLQCIGNPVGGDSIGNALWDGVTLKRILDRAQPKTGIVKAAFFAGDGYSDSIPYALAQSDDVFLAYRMNGEPLPREHGYPLRAVVPGIYGMKNVKWLSKIELVNYNFKGFWEKKGWSDEAISSAQVANSHAYGR